MTTSPPTLRIGTRGSALALWQARHVAGRLTAGGAQVELRTIRTRGDAIQDRPLSRVGGKGLFTKEIEDALLAGEIDLAVHSAKDLPTELPQGLALGAVLEREDPRDALVSRAGLRFADLPAGAKIGTSSLRRAAQLRAHRRDLEIVALRGNVDTRLRRVEEGAVAAAVLALAGLRRLGLEPRVTEVFALDRLLPAPGQGALALEIRAGDVATATRVRPLHHEETAVALAAERALLDRLGGGCQTPIGAHARLDGGRLVLDALVASLDGATRVAGRATGDPANARELGRDLAGRLIADGAEAVLTAARAAADDGAGPPAAP